MNSKMEAIQVNEWGKDPQVVDVNIPSVGQNQILVKMAYAPINPSDLMTINGTYPSGMSLPATIGFEGSGTVEQVGENCVVPHKVGDRVAIVGAGTWTQYAVTPSEYAFPIFPENSFQDSASHFINPATVIVMMNTLKEGGHKAVIHDAGASALGKMLIRLLKQEGSIKIINLVRKDSYFDELTKLGSDCNLNMTSKTFEDDLAKAAKDLEATAYLSAVAGELTGKVLKLMPNNSTAFVYGALSGGTLKELAVDDFIFKGKEVKGLWVTSAFSKMNSDQKKQLFTTIQQNLQTIFKTEFSEFTIDKISDAITHAKEKASHSKSLIKLN